MHLGFHHPTPTNQGSCMSTNGVGRASEICFCGEIPQHNLSSENINKMSRSLLSGKVFIPSQKWIIWQFAVSFIPTRSKIIKIGHVGKNVLKCSKNHEKFD